MQNLFFFAFYVIWLGHLYDPMTSILRNRTTKFTFTWQDQSPCRFVIGTLNDNKTEMCCQAQLVVYHLHLQRSIEMKKCIGVIAPRIPHYIKMHSWNLINDEQFKIVKLYNQLKCDTPESSVMLPTQQLLCGCVHVHCYIQSCSSMVND